MKAKVSILGVCCSCQSAHPVSSNPRPEDVSDPGMPDGIARDEAANYLMAKHRQFGDTGVWCEGEGTVPQAIVQN